MIAALGDIFPQLFVLIASPIPIIAIILVLFSPQPQLNGITFALGWFLGLLIASLVALVVSGLIVSPGRSPQFKGVIDLVLAGLLFWLAFRNWNKRPAPGEIPELPGWMASMTNFTPVTAFRNGLLIAAINPKHIAIIFSAMETIALTDLVFTERFITLLCFAVLGCTSILVPLIYRMVGGEQSQVQLNRLREWLTINNKTVMALLFAMPGFLILGRGLGALFG